MANLQTFGVPGVGSGILHPKMSNRFGVYFTCASTLPAELVTKLLSALSMQTVAVELPIQTFRPPFSGPSRKSFKSIGTKNGLKIRFQDDVTNHVASALDFLANHATDLTVLVAKLDGDEGVTEAYLFGRVRMDSVEHSALDYACTGFTQGSIHGHLVSADGTETAVFDATTNTPKHQNSLQERAVTFIPDYAQHAFFSGSSAVSISDLLKEI
jgi:hypothetical protein